MERVCVGGEREEKGESEKEERVRKGGTVEITPNLLMHLKYPKDLSRIYFPCEVDTPDMGLVRNVPEAVLVLQNYLIGDSMWYWDKGTLCWLFSKGEPASLRWGRNLAPKQ